MEGAASGATSGAPQASETVNGMDTELHKLVRLACRLRERRDAKRWKAAADCISAQSIETIVHCGLGASEQIDRRIDAAQIFCWLDLAQIASR